MRLMTWFRNWAWHKSIPFGKRRPRSDRKRRFTALHVLALEDRVAPATYTWNNLAGGDWDTVANWTVNSAVATQLPGPADDTVINSLNTGAVVTHSQNTTDTVNSVTAAAPLTLAGGTLSVSGNFSDSSTVTLAGGTLGNAQVATGTTINATGNSTLTGVTLAGQLDVNGAVTVTVNGGLTLNNGSVQLEGQSYLSFGVDVLNLATLLLAGSGTQTLAGVGQVSFGGSVFTDDQVDVVSSNAGPLVVGSGISIANTSAGGTVGSATEPLTINGTITAQANHILALVGSSVTNNGPSGSTLASLQANEATLSITNLEANSGGISASVGGTLTLTGSLQNTGTISETSSTLNLNGPAMAVASLGKLNLTGGTVNVGGALTNDGTLGTLLNGATVNLSGTLENTGATLTLNSTWNLDGGTINGGNVTVASSGQLTATSNSTLTGVTLAGPLNVNGAVTVTVNAGLTLNNGSVQLEGQSYLSFGVDVLNLATLLLAGSGTQTLTGVGQVIFAGSPFVQDQVDVVSSNAGPLVVDSGISIVDTSAGGTVGSAGQALTIDGSITASAGNTIVLAGSSVGSSGTLEATNGGSLVVGGPLADTGILQAVAGGSVTLQGVTSINQSGFLAGEAGATITAQGNLTGSTTNAQDFAPPTVTLAGSGTSGSPQLLEAMSDDRGNVAGGFQDNFAYGTLALANNTYVQLVDNAHNSAGTGAEAVYTGSLIVPAGTTLNLNGLHVYARAVQISGTVVGGTVSVLADGGPLQFSTPTPGDLTTAGQVDDWTFFGRAGQAVTVFAGTGSGSQFPPLSPPLNFAQVQLVDPNGTVVATASNTTSGGDATIAGAALSVDGTYHLRVQAAPAQSTSTGNYVLTLWNSSLHTAALDLNETTFGQLASPYAVDQWTFAAMAGQQIQFNRISTAVSGIVFDLTGPNGYTAFSGASTSSGLINLPSSGTYTLTVHAMQPSEGAYAFSVNLTSVTALSSGVPYNGVFAGNGQAQLFTIATPQDKELLIDLQDSNVADQVEVYASFGVAPTQADYQYASALPASISQTILVPTAAPGTWYILVYAASVAAPPQGYTLMATVSPVSLTTVTPTRLGNAADAVLTLTGAGFDNTTTVSLVAGGTTYHANQTQLDLPTQLTATFTAGTVPAGVYSVVVTRGDGFSATLPSVFTMDQGGATNFHANLVTPSTLGYHIASTLYLQYSNTGDLAMPAPILEVTITQAHAAGTTFGTQDALLTLDASIATQGLWTSSIPAGFYNAIQVLASGATPGILEPGESEQIPIYYAGWVQPWDLSYPSFEPIIGLEQTTDTTPIPWATIQSSFQPPDLNTTAWNAVFPAVQALVGNTWGNYVQAMDNSASYLAALGENVTDLSQLWSFVIQQASGFNPIQTLSSMTDAQVDTPGPVLSVDRTFPNYIDARSTLGPFGYGWAWYDHWQQTLKVVNGTVTITDAVGMPNIFEPDSRGGYFEMAGYHDTLTALSGGGFLLQDADGEITAFTSNGQVAYIEDTKGNMVTAGYTNGLLTSLTASTGQSLTMAYNGAGRITSITDSTGRTTSYAYDPTNQYLLSVTDFAGRTTSYTYDTSGAPATANALLSVQNPDGTIDNFTYDGDGRLASTYTSSATVPGLATIQIAFTYGPGGKVAATDGDGGTTQYFFDPRGLIVKMLDPLGNASHYVYDGNYNLTQVIDPAGQVTTNTFDQNGNLIQTMNPDGARVNYTYAGPFNNLTSYTDPNGNKSNYAYNSQGDLLSITYPNHSEQQFSYDPLGNLTETINGNGQGIHNTYNSMGLLTEADFADGTKATYTYDAHGNMLTASNSTGTTTFQYDPVTEDLLEVSYPGGFTLTFQYDSAGRRTRSMDQNGFTVNYSYNDAGLLGGLTDGNNNPIVTYTYDAAANLIRKDMGNSTYTTYQYDMAGNILHLVNYAPSGSVNSRFDYTYNNLGLQTSMTTLDGVWTYQYDPAGQLTQAIFASNNPAAVPNQNLQYMYDPAGNRTETIINGVTTTYVTNDMNQYTQVGSATYSYDSDGNLIAQMDTTGTTAYTYNELNQLTGVSSPTSTSAYQYNPLGQLASMTQNGQMTQYVVDPTGLGNVVGEYNGSGGLVAHYTYGLGLTSRVAAAGQAAYYDFDALGSTVGISDFSGNYQDLYRYLPFGVSVTSFGSIPNLFQYVGQFGVMTQANGLDFMRARFYSSTQGRFLSQDPIGLAGGQTTLYAYAAENPLSFVDLNGLDPSAPEPGGTGPGSPEPGPPEPEVCINNKQDEIDATDSMFEAAILELQKQIINLQYQQALNANDPSHKLGMFLATQLRDAELELLQAEYNQKDEDRKLSRIPECPKPPSSKPPLPPGNICSGGVMPNATGPGQPGDPPLGCAPPAPNPSSHDPNSATGLAGYGPQGFIAPSGVLPYRIDFENDPTATAPAQSVVVTDQLDPNLDWSTFQLTEVGFGDNIIPIPAGSQHFQITVPMTYNDQTFNVVIELGLNVQTGLLTATFQSIDPETSLPPDVLTGFLPPEDGTGRGMGYLSYTILAKAGLPTGTQIRNVADITFDINPPIATDQVNDNDPSQGIDPTKQDLNTIDAGAPTSSVAALPANSSTSFTVSWSGHDDAGGSGVAAYFIYVSDNGGPVTLWQDYTGATSASYTGQLGHTYGFYSVAADNVGNEQSTPSVAQATTLVNITAPTATINSGTSPHSSAVSSLTITFNEPITGLVLSDLSLKQGASTNLLTSAQTLTTTDNITWTLGNLASLTDPTHRVAGFTLTLTAAGSGITDLAGNAMQQNAVGTFTVVDPALTLQGTTLTVPGTAGNDTFTFTAGAVEQASLNGVTYTLDPTVVSKVQFQGNGGTDAAYLTAAGTGNTAAFAAGTASLQGAGYAVTASGVTTAVTSGGGSDSATFTAAAGNNSFYGTSGYSYLSNNAGQFAEALGFGTVAITNTSTGSNSAFFPGAPANSSFTATPTSSTLHIGGAAPVTITAGGFPDVQATAAAGTSDTAAFSDGSGSNLFLCTPGFGYLIAGSFIETVGFTSVTATAAAGTSDAAYFYDGTGSNSFTGKPGDSELSSGGVLDRALGFRLAVAIAPSSNSQDTGTLYGSSGTDSFYGLPGYSYLVTPTESTFLYFFPTVVAQEGTGRDNATLYDGAGANTLVATPQYVHLAGSGYTLAVDGFTGGVVVNGTSGNPDIAYLYGAAAGNDTFTGTPTAADLAGPGFFVQLNNFATVWSYSQGPNDLAYLYDSANGDTLTLQGNSAALTGLVAPSGPSYSINLVLGSGADVFAIGVPGAVNQLSQGTLDYAFSTLGAGTWTLI